MPWNAGALDFGSEEGANMNVIFMGAGEKLTFLLRVFPLVAPAARLLEIWDNSLDRQGENIPFQDGVFAVLPPHAVSDDPVIFITVDRYEEEIRRQLVNEIGIDEKQLRNWRWLFDGVKQEILARYENVPDEEIAAVVDYLRGHELDVFFGGLREQYSGQAEKIQVFFDEAAGLSYVMWHGRRLYMRKNASAGWIQDYVNDIRREQDRRSPHCYGQFLADGLHDAVMVDAGAAEGFFALDFVEEARKVYLIEHDPAWVQALFHTFAPYREKVVIVDKWLGDCVDEEHVTLDSLDVLEDPISFVKMDIEGAEASALAGASHLLAGNRDLQILACLYHRSEDAEVLSQCLLAHHFTAKFSSGYMFFPYGDEVRPELRHGLLYGRKRVRRRVAVWGVGETFPEVMEAIRQEDCELTAILDLRWDTMGETGGLPVKSPEVLRDGGVEYVVLTPKDAAPMLAQGRKIGLRSAQMLPFWQGDLRGYPFIDGKVWEKALAQEQSRKLSMRLANAPYEYGVAHTPQIRSGEAALREILQYKKSLCRVGDGEFEMIRQKARPWFQGSDGQLAIRLKEILRTRRCDLCVAIADNFGSLQKYTEAAADDIRAYMTEGDTRRVLSSFLDEKMIYYDAYVSRPYIIYRDKTWATELFALWKQVWEKRCVLIVEGTTSRMGRGNDLLANVERVRRVLCPGKDAFAVYEKILQAVKRVVEPDELVLISLGPTATVLAYDLAAAGVQAIDVGQLDNEYDWYCMGVTTRQVIPGKTVAELYEGRSPTVVLDEGYEREVIARVE